MPIEYRKDGDQLVWARSPFTGTVTYFTHVHKKESGFVRRAQDALLHPPLVDPAVYEQRVHDELEAARRACPFCPGNEELSPDEVLRVPASQIFPERSEPWLIRAVRNLIPRIPECCTGGKNESYVVIEDCRHFADDPKGHDDLLYSGLLPIEHFHALLQSDVEIARQSYENPFVRQVLIRKNQGRESGASQPHLHNQVIGSDLPFAVIAQECEVTTRQPRVWEDVIAFAREQGHLLIERDGCVAYLCVFGTFPRSYEVVCLDSWERCTEVAPHLWRTFTELLYEVLQILGPIPLDYEIHDGPGVPLHAHINSRHFTYSNIGGTLNLPAHLGLGSAAFAPPATRRNLTTP